MLLLAASCRPAPLVPAHVTDANLRALGKRVKVHFQDESAVEVMNFFGSLSGLNIVSEPSVRAVGPVASMTLQAPSLPLGAVLEAWCARVGLDWTIAPSGPEPGAVVSIVIAALGRIAELERADPVTARRLREYRRGLARELEAADGRR